MFRADTVSRLAPPAELALIHEEERPREAISCERMRGYVTAVVLAGHVSTKEVKLEPNQSHINEIISPKAQTKSLYY